MRSGHIRVAVWCAALGLGLSALAPEAHAQGRYEATDEARRLFEQARALEQKAADLKARRPDDAQDRYEDALELYLDALGADPNFLDAHVRVGYVLYALGRARQAAERLTPVVEANPADIPLRRVYGTVLFELPGRRQEAVGHLEAARAAGVDGFDLFYLLAKHYTELQRWDDATEAFERYLAIRPEDATTHGALGNVHLKAGRLDKAMAQFRRVLELEPGSLLARVNVGNVQFKQGRYEEAIATFREVLAEDPEQLGARFNLASALFQLRRFEEALDGYRAFTGRRPRHVGARYQAAVCLHQLGRQDEAVAAFEALLEIHPDHARSHWHVGMVMMARGELELALARLEIAHQIQPKDPWVLATLSEALEALGRLPEARERAAQAVASGPGQPRFLERLGRVHFATGALDEAVAAFGEAVALDPSNQGASALLTVALLHRARRALDEGRPQDARADGERLLGLGGRVAEGSLVLASAALAAGDADEAARFLLAARAQPIAPCDGPGCLAERLQRAEGRLALLQGDAPRALAALEPLANGERSPDAALTNDLGLALAGVGRWDEALRRFAQARALGLSPEVVEANLAVSAIQVAQQLGEAGQWKEAVEVLELGEALRPRLNRAEQVALDLAFSHAFAEVGNFAQAQRLLAQATAALAALAPDERGRLPDDDTLGLGLREAYILLRLRRYDQAVRLAEGLDRKGARAEDVARLLSAAWALQAQELFKRGQSKPAREALRKAARDVRGPGGEVIQHNLAVLDFLEGRRGQAGQVFLASAEGGLAEALFNYAVYLDSVGSDQAGAWAAYLRAAQAGGPRADEARQIAEAKARVFGFE